MKRSAAIAACALLAATLPLQAQRPDAPRAWVSAWAGLYTRVDAVGDPSTSSTWHFGDYAFSYGAGVEYEVAPNLLLGAETSYATTDFDRAQNGVIAALGSANLISAFATGRLRYGGTNKLGGYLKGMAGAFGYRTPDPDATDFDFALATGAGVEYRFWPHAALALEWNQIWAYHKKGEIQGDNTGRHTLFRLGIRAGL